MEYENYMSWVTTFLQLLSEGMREPEQRQVTLQIQASGSYDTEGVNDKKRKT